MKTRFLACLLVAVLVFTVFPLLAQGEGCEAGELLLVQDGSVVRLATGTRARLTAQVISYFETCHTYEAVVGESQGQTDLRRMWEEQTGGIHVLLELPADVDDEDSPEGRGELLVGFSSGSGAWPVLLRHRDDEPVLYIKCGGLEGLLLACDVHDLVPRSAAPKDCDRLREMRRRSGDGGGAEVGFRSP